MTTSPHPFAEFRRVLIGLGGTGATTAALDLATELAAAFHAEVAGLFFEEDVLYELCDLPTAQALSRAGKPAEIDRQSITDQLAVQARAWRRALSARAELSHVVWSFESRRGEALAILRGLARADDVLLLTGTAGAITLRARVALAIQAMATARAVLVVPDRLRQERGAVVVFDEGEGAHLDLAAAIARTMQEPLLTLTHRRSPTGEVRRDRGRIVQLPDGDPEAIAGLLRRLRPRLVVAQSVGSLFADANIATGLMQAAGAPFLLLRSSG